MTILPLNDDQLDYLKIHSLEKKFNKSQKLIEHNIYHPSLNVEILEPKHLKLYSFRLDKKYRAIFVVRDGQIQIVSFTNHYK